MTPRRTILQELRAAGPDSFVQPSRIHGFESNSAKYRETVNELLKDRLITGSTDENGNLVVAVNPARAKEVNRALSSRLASPLLLVAAGLVVTALLALFTRG